MGTRRELEGREEEDEYLPGPTESSMYASGSVRQCAVPSLRISALDSARADADMTLAQGLLDHVKGYQRSYRGVLGGVRGIPKGFQRGFRGVMMGYCMGTRGILEGRSEGYETGIMGVLLGCYRGIAGVIEG